MSALSERPDALVGSLLGKAYRVLEPIGVGGMAVVYLVEHQTLLKRFAAKVLSPDLASSLEARARFIQEAHAASQLDHDNIVSISDFGTTGDQRPFFVMELLRGQTLDHRLAEGPMSIEEVVAVAVPVARALSHAHGEGIVHLDVKPENIFLVQRTRGRWGVKVVDFGIAKTPLNPRLNKLGETAGSPLYMAPEVCRGDDDVDQRADVYSFGILLYLMMCGRLPFDDDSTQRVLQMQLVELPAPPNEINTQLSPELAMVVERALAKHREDRYPSMEALLYDFAAALPHGADRLLIEAQSGAAAHETPFSGSLSLPRPESHPRASSLPPISPLPVRKRNTPMMVVVAALVAALIGLVGWRELIAPSKGKSDRSLVSATASVPAGAATTPAGAAPASADPASATPAAADPAGAPSTAAHKTADPATVDHAAATASDDKAVPEPSAESPSAAASGDPAAPTADPTAEPATADPEVAKADPPVAVDRPKVDRPAAATKKPLVRSKPPARPVVRTPARPAPAVAKAPPRRGPVIASAAVATPAAAPAAAEPQGAQTAAGSPIETDVQAPAPEPAAPPAPPAETPAPAPPAPAPAAPPRTAAPVATPKPAAPKSAATSPGALDATPSVVSVEVKGSLSPTIVRRSVERTLPALRTCYRMAARAAKATPAVDLRLSFEIDENSLATQVQTSGANFGSLATCAAGVTSQIRTQEAPDVGTAQVTAVIRFRPS